MPTIPICALERMMRAKWGKRLEEMTTEEMYALHQEVTALLTERLKARKIEVERELDKLDKPASVRKQKPLRR
jgi:hypothetical protein